MIFICSSFRLVWNDVADVAIEFDQSQTGGFFCCRGCFINGELRVWRVFHIYITRGVPGVAPGGPTDGLTEGLAGPNARFYHCLTH